MKIQPVTMADIAREVRLSVASVSRALRNDPRLSESTRRRVSEAAERLGYRPNALVSIFQAQVRARRARLYQANIAWIDDQEDPAAWHHTPWLRGYFQGASRRAAEQGYKLEVIRLEELRDWSPDLNVSRFARILDARGIHGAILPLLTHPSLTAGDWPCAVAQLGSREAALENPQARPPLEPKHWHKALPDYFHNTLTAMREIRRLGYRRPGLVLTRWLDRFTDWQLKGGFLAAGCGMFDKPLPPPLILAEMEDTAALAKWLARCRPDCVLCAHGAMRRILASVGLKAPEDIGLVHLSHAEDVRDWAGVCEQHEALGAAAADIVISQLRRNERGLPALPRATTIRGIWVPGATVRPQPA